MRSIRGLFVRVGVVLAIVTVGLVGVAESASAVSTGCTSMNGSSVDGTYSDGSAIGDFEAGEVLTIEVSDTDAVVANFQVFQGVLVDSASTSVPGQISYAVPASGAYTFLWSVPLPVGQVPTWFVSCNADSDADGIADDLDNCPQVANLDQADLDGDGRGDACDAVNDDRDADGVFNEVDNCPDAANPGQADLDGDGAGDACDAVNDDLDTDGVFNVDDNCPTVANPGQADADGDGIGNACDPVNDDVDADGVPNVTDNCPEAANPGQADADGDGIGNVCDPVNDDVDADGVPNVTDNCPSDANAGQADADSDGIGDACDPLTDTDGDGVANSGDNCPTVVNPSQSNNDGDQAGDVCDLDDDNDGVADLVDACPTVFGTGTNGCVDLKPTLALTSPAPSAVLNPALSTLIAATATDDHGVVSVTFLVGARSVCVDSVAPFACSWKPTERETGRRVITAVARDTVGGETRATRTVIVNRFKPALRVAVVKVGKKVRAVGRLLLPAGTTVANACTGVVKVRLTGDKKIRNLRATLKRSGTACTFATALVPRYKVNPKAKATFGGNAILLPIK